MFPSQRWARAYLLGLGGYWGLIGIVLLATRGDTGGLPFPVGLAIFACGAIPIGTWFRWMWVNRRSLSGLLIAYVAGINYPSQFAGAFRVARWDWRKGTAVLVALLVADVGFMQMFLAS